METDRPLMHNHMLRLIVCHQVTHMINTTQNIVVRMFQRREEIFYHGARIDSWEVTYP